MEAKHFKLPLQVRTRRAGNADFEFLWKLHQAAMRESVIGALGSYDEEQQYARLKKHFSPWTLFVFERFRQPIGTIDVARMGDFLYVSCFALMPEYQGIGLGRSAMQSVIDYARCSGEDIQLTVLKRSRARSFYENLGFSLNETFQDEHLDLMFLDIEEYAEKNK
ncbi:hypothetical protein [Microcystis phage Mwe-JY26]